MIKEVFIFQFHILIVWFFKMKIFKKYLALKCEYLVTALSEAIN